MSERKPTSIADAMANDPTFAHDEAGKMITRQRSCECGVSFTQRLLSERFLSLVEHRGKHALDVMAAQVPGFYVPVHCPQCERRDLGRRARLDDLRSLPDHYQDKDHAAD